MNITVYIFGQFNNGYTQYPDDYTKSKFQAFNLNAKSATQIAIHRDGDLMYYGYIRKLEKSHYIGFCIVVNGLMLTQFDGLFSLYENAISTLVTNGQLIHFDQQGNIVANVDRLYIKSDEISVLTDALRVGFYYLKSNCKQLPSVNYGVSNVSIRSFSSEDNLADIIMSGHTNGYTYVHYTGDLSASQLNSYKEVLGRLNKEKIELTEHLKELSREHGKLKKQKKQYRFVAILFLIALGCLLGLLYLNSNLRDTAFALNKANNTIDIQSDSINNKSSQISSLENENQALNVKYQKTEFLRQQAETNFDTLHDMITSRQSFFIRRTSFDFNTGYLSFSYFGFIEESLKIQVKVYNDKGYLFGISTDIDLLLGNNTAEVYINRYLDNKTWYSFIILRNNVIIGGDRH